MNPQQVPFVRYHTKGVTQHTFKQESAVSKRLTTSKVSSPENGSLLLPCSSLAARSSKLACSLGTHHRQEAGQHSPLSKDWRTVSGRIELACGLWQLAPTPRHLPVGYKACGNSCESDRFYPGTLLQKPSPHCQLPAEKKERVIHWNTYNSSKILLGIPLA